MTAVGYEYLIVCVIATALHIRRSACLTRLTCILESGRDAKITH